MKDINEEQLSWLAFSAFVGVGPRRFALLTSYFGSAKKAWRAKDQELRAIGLGEKLTAEFVKFRQEFDPASYYLRVCEKKIGLIFLTDKNYPDNLKKIDNPPFVIYITGGIRRADSLAVAVVGSRMVTGYGRTVTEKLAGELAAAGVTVVSGLARGVDSLAHRAAIGTAGGRTIGVLGCGLDVVYPPENTQLVGEIAAGRGAVISEYPLGQLAVPGNFPARNRLISGLSLGVVVVEGAEKSGSLITARAAAEQGREVFAVPGPITSRLSAGPAALIRQGAKLVTRVEDILEELKIADREKRIANREILPETKEEALLAGLVADEAKSIDRLVRETGWEVGYLMSTLSVMEMKGLVKETADALYIRVR